MNISQRLSFAAFIFLFFLFSCNNNQIESSAKTTDTLTDAQQRLPENALKGLEVFEGLGSAYICNRTNAEELQQTLMLMNAEEFG